MTAVKEGGFYGWPYSYFGEHLDPRVSPQRPDLVAKAIVPDYALGPHTASLGLAFYDGALLPERYRGGAFIGQHGSWNRDPPQRLQGHLRAVRRRAPVGSAEDVLTGFLSGRRRARAPGRRRGRQSGALLVADDVGNIIWRVTPSRQACAAQALTDACQHQPLIREATPSYRERRMRVFAGLVAALCLIGSRCRRKPWDAVLRRLKDDQARMACLQQHISISRKQSWLWAGGLQRSKMRCRKRFQPTRATN